MHPSSPIYIVSKNRWSDNLRLTSRALEAMGLAYSIVVEPFQADDYRAVVNPKLATVLVLDPVYQTEYDTCDDLGNSKSKGAGPARNFAWQHAIDRGFAWHWVLDDNIRWFLRLHQNQKRRVFDGACFRAMEDFVGRYVNVAMAGPNYKGFAAPRMDYPPFSLNTRIYSCNLIRNDVPFRWRGRYNEDTILSLDLLKAGWCTVQFYAFLQEKITTQTMPGGNTDEFYANEGTLPKSQMLVRQHSDVCRLAWRRNRPHHYCDYRPFKANRLMRKPGLVIPEGVNEYGMQLVNLADRAGAS